MIAEDAAGSSATISAADTFAKILTTVNILVVGYTISQLIPIALIKREKTQLEKQDFEEWQEMRGFPDDPCYNCDHCASKKYGVCKNPPNFFRKVFRWVPPTLSPEEFSEEEFDVHLRSEKGRRFLENYRTEDGQPIGSYEPIVKSPFETWKQNERKKYEQYYEFCVSGNNQSGRKLKRGKMPEEILPIDDWREERRSSGYQYVIPGAKQEIYKRRHHRRVPRATERVISIGIVVAVSLGVAAWWGVDLILLATAAGGMGIGLGLALQETFQNYFAYFLLRKNRVFEEGQRVKLESGYDGFIHRITPRVTYVRHALSESIATIPTRQLVNSVVINYTKEIKMVPAKAHVGVSYLHDARQVAAILVKVGTRVMEEVLDRKGRHMVVHNRCPYLDEHKPSCGCDRNVRTDIDQPVVRFRQFNDSSLDFQLWVYARDYTSHFKVESEMLTVIQEEFRKYNITIPWPIRTVYTGDQKEETKDIAKLDSERNKLIEEYGRGETALGGADEE